MTYDLERLPEVKTLRKKELMHNYQNVGQRHAIVNKNCALFMDMGLGKTITTLTTIEYLMYQDFQVSAVLVIAPKKVMETVWHTEAQGWEHTKHVSVVRIRGTPKQRRRCLETHADVHVISISNLAWLCSLYPGGKLPFDMVVIDEMSMFKNSKTQRFKIFKHYLDSFSRIVGLTGTPAPNGLIDLWSQVYLLDRGQRLGKYISQYRENYFNKGKTNGHIVYNYNIQNDGEERIYDAIGDICISMQAEDYLELPPRVDNYIEIELPEDVKKRYDDFERDKVLELVGSGQEIAVVNAAALGNKLQQYANGAVYDEDKNWSEVHTEKIDKIVEMIEHANGAPVLIAWAFRHDMYRLTEALKKYKPTSLDPKDPMQTVDAWNRGDIPLLLMHPASGGHGLNLQGGGSIVIWFGLTWSLEQLLQLNARIYRQGQTKPVVIHRLVAKGTVDEDIVRSNKNKDKQQDGLLKAVKALIKKYCDE